MFNLRICAVAAGIAFILSFLIGIISGVSMPLLLLRPFLLAAAFFLLTAVIYFLARNFLPELLNMDSHADVPVSLPGSRVNITEGDTSDTITDFPDGDSPEPSRRSTPAHSKQIFMGAQADDSEEGLGNISDLMGRFAVSGDEEEGTPLGMDQKAQDGYTGIKSRDERPDPEYGSEFYKGSAPAETQGGSAGSGANPARTSASADLLPDLDSMAGAFLPSSAEMDSDSGDYSIPAASKKPSAGGGKTPAWSGDFNAKDMAAGLRTILRKEKEG